VRNTSSDAYSYSDTDAYSYTGGYRNRDGYVYCNRGAEVYTRHGLGRHLVPNISELGGTSETKLASSRTPPLGSLMAYDAEFSGGCWQLRLKLADYVTRGKNYLKKY